MKNKHILLVILLVIGLIIYLYHSNKSIEKLDVTLAELALMPLITSIKINNITDLLKHADKKLLFEITNNIGESFPTNPTFLSFIKNDITNIDKGCENAENCGLYSIVISKQQSPFILSNYELKNGELKFNAELNIDKKQLFLLNKYNKTACLSDYVQNDTFMTKDAVAYISQVGSVFVLYMKMDDKQYFLSQCIPKCKMDGAISRVCLTDDINKAIKLNIYTYTASQQGGAWGACIGGIGIGKCGSDKAKTVVTMDTTNNQLIVNDDSYENTLSQSQESISNIINNATKSCSTSNKTSQVNELEAEDIVATGPGSSVTIGNDQSMQVDIQTECIQKSNLQTEVLKQMQQSIMSDLINKMDDKTKNQVAARADAAASTGFAALPLGPTPDSSVKQRLTNNYKQYNTSDEKITNILNTVAESNFTNNDVQNCINDSNNEQKIRTKYKNIKAEQGGTVTINSGQTQQVKVFNKCIQDASNISKVIDNLATTLDLKVTREKTRTSNSTTDAAATATAKAAGLENVVDSAGKAGAGLITAAGDAVAKNISAMMGPIVIIGIVAVIGIGAVAFFLFFTEPGKKLMASLTGKKLSFGKKGFKMRKQGNSFKQSTSYPPYSTQALGVSQVSQVSQQLTGTAAEQWMGG